MSSECDLADDRIRIGRDRRGPGIDGRGLLAGGLFRRRAGDAAEPSATKACPSRYRSPQRTGPAAATAGASSDLTTSTLFPTNGGRPGWGPRHHANWSDGAQRQPGPGPCTAGGVLDSRVRDRDHRPTLRVLRLGRTEHIAAAFALSTFFHGQIAVIGRVTGAGFETGS